MTVSNLINNSEFCFNPEIRIMRYNFDKDESTTLYDERNDGVEIPVELMSSSISAVNMGDDGVVEIEII